MNSFGLDFSHLFHLHEIFDPAGGPLTDKYLPWFCMRFKPGDHIYLVPDDRKNGVSLESGQIDSDIFYPFS
jgi:hypothetical protein